MKQRFSLVLMLMSAVSFIYGQCECPPISDRPNIQIEDNVGLGTDLGLATTPTFLTDMSSSNLARL